MSTFTLLVVLSLIFLFVMLQHQRRAPLPPGPKGLPFIGNIHQLPRSDLFKTYSEWSKRYGPITYMHIFGQEFIIINSYNVATELCERRSSIYSTRWHLVMAGKLVGRNRTSMLFTMYGQRLKNAHQIIHGWINQRVVHKYWLLQELYCHRLLEKLLESPEDFSQHIRDSAGSVILKLTYSIETNPPNDRWSQMAEELNSITSIASEPVYYIPSWCPGAGFKQWAKRAWKLTHEIAHLPYTKIKDEMEKGVAAPCFISDYLQNPVGDWIGSEEIALISAAGSLYSGAIDTVVCLTRTFILMMARHPDIQRKAQAEIDWVIGTEHLPTMDYRPSLPYIQSLIKELHRINAIVPLIPHSLDQDDIYGGYTIPKGAWVMVNNWAIMNDPDVYKNPKVFNPDRFNPALGYKVERDPTIISFRWSRRACPGMHFAQATIFLNITNTLSAFNILPIKDNSGKEVPPPLAFDVGHLSMPSPFHCSIVPRSADKAHIVHEMLKYS